MRFSANIGNTVFLIKKRDGIYMCIFRRIIISSTNLHLSLPADLYDYTQRTFTHTTKLISCGFWAALPGASFPPTCEQSASLGVTAHQQLLR